MKCFFVEKNTLRLSEDGQGNGIVTALYVERRVEIINLDMRRRPRGVK